MDPPVIRTAIHFHFRLHCSNHGMRSGDVHLGYEYVKELLGVNSIVMGYGERRHVVLHVSAIWLGYRMLSGRSSERS